MRRRTSNEYIYKYKEEEEKKKKKSNKYKFKYMHYKYNDDKRRHILYGKNRDTTSTTSTVNQQ